MYIIMTKINIDAGGTQLNTYNIHNINFVVALILRPIHIITLYCCGS